MSSVIVMQSIYFVSSEITFKSMSSSNLWLDMLGMIAITVLILVLTYFTTRWIGRRSQANQSSRNIKVKERVQLGKDKYLAIIEIAGKSLLIGVTNQSVQLISEIDSDMLNYPEATEQPSFGKIYQIIKEKGIKGLSDPLSYQQNKATEEKKQPNGKTYSENIDNEKTRTGDDK